MSKPFDLKFIPFSQLHISKLNMRHSDTAPDIDDILPSVKERLAAIAAEGIEIADVPCCVMDAKDDALAIETSIIENISRLTPQASAF